MFNYKAHRIILMSFLLFVTCLAIDSSNMKIQNLDKNTKNMTFFSSNQTWYGDFIVNPFETVAIENSNFTVIDGKIRILGTLIILNSTIHMFSKSYYKYILLENYWDSANLTIVNSKILGKVIIRALCISFISIINSSIDCVQALDAYPDSVLNIFNSNFSQLWGPAEQSEPMPAPIIINVAYSSGELVRLYTGATNISVTESDISFFVICIYYDSLDLQLQPGFIEQKSIIGALMGLNITISNSYIHKWMILLFGSTLYLSNSTIESIFLRVSSSMNLSLNSGFVDYKHVVCDSDLTVINSTVNNWSIQAVGGDLRISNSSKISITVYGLAQVYVNDSTVNYVKILDYKEGLFIGNLEITNSTVNLFTMLLRSEILIKIANLSDGYQTSVIAVNNWRAFLTGTTINHISIVALSTLELYNCTLSGYFYEELWTTYYGIIAYGDISITNSHVADMLSQGVTVNITNSKIDLFHAYGGTITAINSTIDTLISDPLFLNLVNSEVLFEVEIPFPLVMYSTEYSESALQISILDEVDTPLPEGVKPLTKFLNLTTTYSDVFETRIKIYYNESKVNETGVNEDSLRIYELNSENTWIIPTIQGLNKSENFAWVNVTSFSCFVVGYVAQENVDIAILNITLSNQNPKVNETLTVSVKVKNLGNIQTTFNLILNYTRFVDPTIGNESVTLDPNQTLIINYTWVPNASGRYKLTAYITNIVDDINNENNQKEIIFYVTSNMNYRIMDYTRFRFYSLMPE